MPKLLFVYSNNTKNKWKKNSQHEARAIGQTYYLALQSRTYLSHQVSEHLI